MTAARYDIRGLRLAVDAEDDFLLGAIDDLVAQFAVGANGTTSEFSLAMRYGLLAPIVSPPPTMRQFWSGELAGGPRMTYFTSPAGRLVDMPGIGRLRIDLVNRSADLVVSPTGEKDRPAQLSALSDGCIVPLLCEFLAAINAFVMHAACLAMGTVPFSGSMEKGTVPLVCLATRGTVPISANDGGNGDSPSGRGNQDSPPAILLTGASGRGKTTASLALAHSGMAFLTDDVTIICDNPPGDQGRPLTAWGLARPCKVLDNTFRMLPWLAEYRTTHRRRSGEQAIDVAAQIQPLAAGAAGAARPDRVRPRAIFFLDPPNPQGHRITPLDKVAAIALMMRENLRAVETAASGSTARAFGTFTRLVAQCDTYLLSAGPRMDELAGAIDGALGD